VLNEITPTELKANIDFGLAKMKLLIGIYNWRISYPQMKIFLALADITACFHFPRMHADVTGAWLKNYIFSNEHGLWFEHIRKQLGAFQKGDSNIDSCIVDEDRLGRNT